MPKISIIVPCYNVEKYVKKCIESLLNQSFQDIQIIVVDDGSKDSTSYIIKTFNDPRIEYYYKENGGLSDARNFGLNYVKGEYVAFLDSDDYVEPEMYKLLYENAIKNDSDVVECAYFKDYLNNKITSHYIEDRQYKIVKFTPYNAWNKLYKISLFKDSALLFPKGLWYEDLNFNLKLSYFVKKTSFVQVPLYHYVQRDGSIVHTVNNKIFDIYKIVEDIKLFLSEKKDYDFNDVNWYIAKELLVASFFRFCKYDAENKTKFSRNNYNYLCSNFPNWKKSTCLKKNSPINIYLRFVNKFFYELIRKIFVLKYKMEKRG